MGSAERTRTLHELPLLPGGTFGGASAVNNNNVIVGYSEVGGGPYTHGFIYNGTMHDLGTFGGHASSASDINSFGKATGYAETSQFRFRPYYYDGVMHTLGVLPGFRDGYGDAINDANWVAGTLGGVDFVTQNSYSHAFVYDGVMHDLGALGVHSPSGLISTTTGYGINNRGQVVGRADPVGSTPRAFLYARETGMLDLNTLVDPSSGWQLTAATDINDRGQIVGSGLFQGQERAFLLEPAPDSTPIPPLVSQPAVPPGNGLSFTGRVMSVAHFQGASLNGGVSTGPVNVTVDSGPELVNFGSPGFLTVDISSNRVQITATADQPLLNIDTLRIGDVNGTIRRMTQITLSGGWPGFDASRINSDGNYFTLNLSGLSGRSGQTLSVNVQIVPEPDVAYLVLLVGCATIGSRRVQLGTRPL